MLESCVYALCILVCPLLVETPNTGVMLSELIYLNDPEWELHVLIYCRSGSMGSKSSDLSWVSGNKNAAVKYFHN